jgi:hypothetical protein
MLAQSCYTGTSSGVVVCEGEQVTFRGPFSSTIRHAGRCVCMRDAAPRNAAYRRKSAPRAPAQDSANGKIREHTCKATGSGAI